MLPAAMCERHRVELQVEPHLTVSILLKIRDKDKMLTMRVGLGKSLSGNQVHDGCSAWRQLQSFKQRNKSHD